MQYIYIISEKRYEYAWTCNKEQKLDLQDSGLGEKYLAALCFWHQKRRRQNESSIDAPNFLGCHQKQTH